MNNSWTEERKDKVFAMSILTMLAVVALICGIFTYHETKRMDAEIAERQAQIDAEWDRIAQEFARQLAKQYSNIYDDHRVNDRICRDINNDENYIEYREALVPVYGNKVDNDYTAMGFVTNVDNQVDYYLVQYVYQCLDRIPKEAIDRLLKDGWHIYLTTDNLAEKEGYDPTEVSIGGVTYRADKEIWLQADEANYLDIATTHEVGHALMEYVYDHLDRTYGVNEETYMDYYEFQNFYLHDSRTYFYNDFLEMTAQMFVEYIYYPKETRNFAPMMTKYFDWVCGKRALPTKIS